jgi:solute carrier family 25 (mitochondrial oxoglutarate transporter), member 11
MAADTKLPPAERRNYANVGNALVRISREEGVMTLVKTGLLPTIGRAVVLNIAQLATYDHFKSVLKRFGLKEGLQTQFMSSIPPMR